MRTDEIREAFLHFFEEREHTRRASASLIPVDDPTLLFTNAGMVPFKPYFMGRAEPPSRRMTTVQRCFRTTDIEDVGDSSHHTYFEMLGNFSVGDYFKEQAIPWAWDFCTRVLQLDPERIHATVYLDDDEAYALWHETIGLPEERIWRYGEEEGNYWFSGDVGPCGPCSELHFDFGEQESCGPDCQPSHGPDHRWLEIWNLVFMSFMQHEDGSRTPLPQKNIDTGAGLERLARAVQNVPTTYETDGLQHLTDMVTGLIDRRYGDDPQVDLVARVVVDHSRAATYLIHDGVLPSNEGRGYVLRRMIRRAVFFARSVGMPEGFLARMAEAMIEDGQERLPTLLDHQQLVLSTLRREEEQFRRTLERGIARFEDLLAGLPEGGVIPGEEAFRLYDTYGLPKELTVEMAHSRGWTVDEEGFERALEEQRERGRAASDFVLSRDELADTYAKLRGHGERFTGYEHLARATHVTGLIRDAHLVERAEEGQEIGVVLAETPFYPEGGGQVGDGGTIEADTGRLEVLDTQRVESGVIVHRARVGAGSIAVNDQVQARVDPARRADAARNHTGTHLLHAALRSVLGEHVRQMGSLVASDRLRFDYSHTEATNQSQRDSVREIVNERIRRDIAVQTRETSFDEAVAAGALAFFGDKYGDTVRVVSIADGRNGGPFSTELCGGTHVHETGEVGFFTILSDSSIGSGVRRLEALTGSGAERWIAERIRYLDSASRLLNTSAAEVEAKILSLQAELDDERRKRVEDERKRGQAVAGDLTEQAEDVNGAKMLVAQVDATNPNAMRQMGDTLKQRLGSSVIVLGATTNGRTSLLAMVTSDLTARVGAGDVIKHMTGGRGGGRADMAQGGGIDASQIGSALDLARQLVKEALSGSG
ncbi:MAG: alanine--tRNA ligase [Dehalococcoidia bacterium]